MAVSIMDVQPNVVTSDLRSKVWVFYGESGTRKTSVACSFPDHLLLAYDMGYKFINGANAFVLKDWASFKRAVKQLDFAEAKERYKVIVVDTVNMAYNACYDYVLTSLGISDPSELGFGKAWRKIRLEFESVLNSIPQKGYGLVLIAHSDEPTVDVDDKDKDKDKKVPTKVKLDIDKRPNEIINRMADFVLYLRKEPKTENPEVGTVYAYSQAVNAVAKSRSMFFAPKFEFTYDNLQKELDLSIHELYESQGLDVPEVDQINPYDNLDEDFESIKNECKNLAVELAGVNDNVNNKVMEIIGNVFGGKTLTEIEETKHNCYKMNVLRSELEDLKTNI